MRFQVKGALGGGGGGGGGGIRYPCPPFGSRKVDSLQGVDTETQCTFSEDVEKKKGKLWRRQKKTQGSMEEAAKWRKHDKRNTAAGRQGKSKVPVQTGVEKVGTKNPTYIRNIPSTSSSALDSSNGWTVMEFPARLSSCISSVKHHHQSLSVSSRTHH